MKQHEASGTTENEEYQKARGLYNERHMCRIKPLPKDFIESLQALKEDSTVYVTM
jgi:L-proline amide hydrolase